MKASGTLRSNSGRHQETEAPLLMKHVDPFYRFGFDNAIADHVHQGQSLRKM